MDSHVKGTVMATSPTTEVDFIEELKLRRWARENYVPQPNATAPGTRSSTTRWAAKTATSAASGSASPAARA